MKLFSSTFIVTLAWSVLMLARPVASPAAVVTYNYNGINQAIPDGNILGWSDVRTLSGVQGTILSVEVMLDIAGGFTGDLYAQLIHSSGFAVLLNRPGRTAINPSGYLDSGLSIVLADNAGPTLDIHAYRMALFGNHTTALSGALTGTWKPDGRAVDPAVVLDTHLRTALLGSFNTLDPNGDWTLFIADMDSGGQATIQNWGLAIELLVPEPRSTTLLMISLIALMGSRRTRRLS